MPRLGVFRETRSLKETNMYAHKLPIHLVRALAPRRFAAGFLVTVALLSAACAGDTTAPTSPKFAPVAAAFQKAPPPAPSATNIVVKPSSMHGWYFWNDFNDTPTGSPGEFVVGPANPPLGIGSVRLGPLTTASGATGESVIATNEFSGTKLTDITGLAYSTFQTGPTLAIALQFDVRYRPTDVAYGGRLVFEPDQNGTVAVGSGWQSWSPLRGTWWATKTTPAGTGGVCAQSTPCTWAQITNTFPNAIISGRFLLKAGSNWPGFDGNADALTVAIGRNAETFDFEPDLGGAATSNFTVLANAAVTCSENGIITGDVGTFLAPPTGSVTPGNCTINGTIHVGDRVAKQAYNDFLSAYAALAPKPKDVCPIITGSLAGQNLAPGVYCVSSEAKTGTLTLTGPANGTWTFKVPSGALTGTNFLVVMAGDAQACNVTWWVDAAATMTTSAFQGNILAGAAITMSYGTFNGNAWSQADVTITGTAVTGCDVSKGKHHKDKDKDKDKCNQGVGNGREGCDPGHSNHHNSSNDEDGGTPGHPGRNGGH
jgi:hypothetical protein